MATHEATVGLSAQGRRGSNRAGKTDRQSQDAVTKRCGPFLFSISGSPLRSRRLLTKKVAAHLAGRPRIVGYTEVVAIMPLNAELPGCPRGGLFSTVAISDALIELASSWRPWIGPHTRRMDQFAAERYAQKLCIRYVSVPSNHPNWTVLDPWRSVRRGKRQKTRTVNMGRIGNLLLRADTGKGRDGDEKSSCFSRISSPLNHGPHEHWA